LTETLRTEGVPAAFLTLDTAGGDHSFIDKYRITVPVLNDQDRQVRVASLPLLVVVDTQGRPAAGWTGLREGELSELQTALALLNLEHGSSNTLPAAARQDELAKMGDATARISAVASNTEVVAFGSSAGRQVAIVGVPGLNSALRERLLAALTPEQAKWVRLIGVRYTRDQLMTMKDRVDQVFSQLPQDETQHTMTGLDYVRGVIDIYTPRGNTSFIAAVRAVAPPDMLSFHWGGVTFRPN
jgi:hypothetical protein